MSIAKDINNVIQYLFDTKNVNLDIFYFIVDLALAVTSKGIIIINDSSQLYKYTLNDVDLNIVNDNLNSLVLELIDDNHELSNYTLNANIMKLNDVYQINSKINTTISFII